jgi:hypothetical protein
MEAGEFLCMGELIYELRPEFLTVLSGTNDEKYIHRTLLKYYQCLNSLQSPVVAMEAGEFP